MGCPFVKSRLHVVETLDKSDSDSVQIKAALVDQIREYGGCFEWPEDDLQGPPNVLQAGTLPDIPTGGFIGTGDQYDVAGYDGSDDYADTDKNSIAFLRAAELGDINRVEELLPEADINFSDRGGNTALILASQNGQESKSSTAVWLIQHSTFLRSL